MKEKISFKNLFTYKIEFESLMIWFFSMIFIEDPKVMMGKCSVCKNVLIRNYAASAYD